MESASALNDRATASPGTEDLEEPLVVVHVRETMIYDMVDGSINSLKHSSITSRVVTSCCVQTDQLLQRPQEGEEDEHVHYSHRAPWLRAFVLVSKPDDL